jgi:hypothetical protein
MQTEPLRRGVFLPPKAPVRSEIEGVREFVNRKEQKVWATI